MVAGIGFKAYAVEFVPEYAHTPANLDYIVFNHLLRLS